MTLHVTFLRAEPAESVGWVDIAWNALALVGQTSLIVAWVEPDRIGGSALIKAINVRLCRRCLRILHELFKLLLAIPLYIRTKPLGIRKVYAIGRTAYDAIQTRKSAGHLGMSE